MIGDVHSDADLEIALRRLGDQNWGVELRFSPPGSDGDVRLAEETPVRFDFEELRLIEDDAGYGDLLTRSLLPPPAAVAFAKARQQAEAEAVALRVRLFVAASGALHGLRWETLRDPETGASLLTNEKVLFSRYLSSRDWRPVRSTPRAGLRALAVVASPRGIEAWRAGDHQLHPVDVGGELDRARESLKGIPLNELASGGSASLDRLLGELRTGPDVLYLACHGYLVDGEPQLVLEKEDGSGQLVHGSDLVARLDELERLPRLVVLASCQSAGNGPAGPSTRDGGALAPLGPRLAEIGVPAVIAMQGNISMATVARFMPTFFGELGRHGQIDRAVAVARGQVRSHHDWWMPVLFMRLKSGRLWSQEAPEGERAVASVVAPPALPRALSSFVGRRDQVQEVRQLVLAHRLVSLVGPGGCGKTRLALEVLGELAGPDDRAVFMVDLAPLAAPAQVAEAVAKALGVPTTHDTQVLDALRLTIGRRRVLLLLDNCEHLLDACTTVAVGLLESCPELTVLTTSREALRCSGETVWAVPPLSVPGPGPPPASMADLSGSESVQLFVERAKAVDATFAPTDKDAPLLASICQRLDGLPLAIEMAAARARLMSLEEIVTGLDDRFQLLTDGSRSALPHQRTLLATLDWSYGLLGPAERRLLRRLAVFAGPFSRAGAAQVCQGNGLEHDQVTDLLARLVDSSLVVLLPRTSTTTRFRLLETVKAYGRHRLEQSKDDSGHVRLRHATFCTDLAEAAEPKLTSPERKDWLGRLDAEQEEFENALEWAFGPSGDRVTGARLAGALFWFWALRGLFTQGRRWSAQAAASLNQSTDAALAAKALYAAGGMSYLQGDLTLAQQQLSASAEAWRRAGQGRGLALTLTVLGAAELLGDQLDAARDHARESAEIFRSLGDRWGLALALTDLGNILGTRGEADHPAAAAALAEAQALWEAVDEPWGLSLVLSYRGRLALRTGDYATAAETFGQALAIQVRHEDIWGRASTLTCLGELALRQGDHGRARELYQEGLELNQQLGRKQLVLACLLGLAVVAKAGGQAERAVQLYGAAGSLQAGTGLRLSRTELAEQQAHVAELRHQLGESAYQEALQQGGALGAADLSDYATGGPGG